LGKNIKGRELIKAIIFDIKRYAIHDGPGIRTTIFFKGCPLRCPWCHNPEGIKPGMELIFWEDRCISCGDCAEVCSTGAIIMNGKFPILDTQKCNLCGECVKVCHAEAREIVGKEYTVEEIMQEIEKDIIFYDESGGGVSFSGGEPLMQPRFLLEILKRCKEKYIHTALDTSGYADREILAKVSEFVDLFLYDIKLIDSKKHRFFTGVPNEPILENLRYLSNSGKKINIRIPLIPGVNDDIQNIEKTAEFLVSLPEIKYISLLPYHSSWKNKFKKLSRPWEPYLVEKPREEQLEEIKQKFESFGFIVKIGG